MQKFITIKNDRKVLEEVESIPDSIGLDDANKIIRTNSDGMLDKTFFYEASRKIKCSENIFRGAFINIFDSDGIPAVRLAKAYQDYESTGFVLQDALKDEFVTVYFEGVNSALTNLIIGKRYYLSTIAGEVISLPPDELNLVSQFIGRAISNNTIRYEASDGIILL